MTIGMIIGILFFLGCWIWLAWEIKNAPVMEDNEEEKDEYKVIRSDNLTVVQGWECKKCGVIRPSYQEKCICHE